VLTGVPGVFDGFVVDASRTQLCRRHDSVSIAHTHTLTRHLVKPLILTTQVKPIRKIGVREFKYVAILTIEAIPERKRASLSECRTAQCFCHLLCRMIDEMFMELSAGAIRIPENFIKYVVAR
jgi:hypothetical protein